MAFQSNVNRFPVIGVAGQRANIGNDVIHTAINYLAGSTGAVKGAFVWLDADGFAVNVPIATETPLGFVEHKLDTFNYDLLSEASMAIPQGQGMAIAKKGDFYALSTTIAVVGQAVFASETDGSISTDAVGATVVGYIETPWLVETPGAAIGDTFIISSWRQ